MTTTRFPLAWVTTFAAPEPYGPWAPETGTWADGGFHTALARRLDSAGFDLLVIDDGDRAGQDLLALGAMLGATTTNLRVVPTSGIDTLAPYHVARALATLSHILGGRIGWNAGLDRGPRVEARAAEFADVMTALWESWEPGALLLDRTTPTFADFERVRPIDHVGPFFRSRGPLNALPPKTKPWLTVTQDTAAARGYASAKADVVVLPSTSPADMRRRRDEILDAASDAGRAVTDLTVLFAIRPVLADTDEDAAELDLMAGSPAEDALGLVGTPATVASRLVDILEQSGGDGFAVVASPNPHYVAEITEGLVPALDILLKGRVHV